MGPRQAGTYRGVQTQGVLWAWMAGSWDLQARREETTEAVSKRETGEAVQGRQITGEHS